MSAFNVEKRPGESLLPLKNDPGSHFSTGSLFNVTPGVVRIQLETYISNFFIPFGSEQLSGANANEMKRDHSLVVIGGLDPRYD